MEQNISIFENPDFGKIRIQMNANNEPMFCLSDVASALDIKNTGDLKARLNPKGIALTDTPTNGGIQQLNFINEGNLYKCIFKSRRPDAEKFQDWVCDEVLPTIRKTGEYVVTSIVKPQQHKPKQVNASKKRVEAFGAWVTMLSSAMNLDEYSKYMLIKQEGEQLMFPVPEAPVCEAPVDNLTNLLNAHNVMNGNKPMKAHAFHVLLVNKGYMREIPRAKSNGKPDNYYSFTDKGLKFGINRWDKYSSSPKSKDYFFIDKFSELLKELNLV